MLAEKPDVSIGKTKPDQHIYISVISRTPTFILVSIPFVVDIGSVFQSLLTALSSNLGANV